MGKLNRTFIKRVDIGMNRRKFIGSCACCAFASMGAMLLNNSLWSELLHKGFAHQRKTLINNLKGFNNISDIKLQEVFESADINKNIRAEDLTCGQWQKIFFQVRGEE